jgi:hypothetical protein
MAFIWYFAGQEIYDTANLGSHEQWITHYLDQENGRAVSGPSIPTRSTTTGTICSVTWVEAIKHRSR